MSNEVEKQVDPCPVCGGEPLGPDWGALIEYSYGEEQTCLMCCDSCGFSFATAVQPDLLPEGGVQLIETTLMATWNVLSRLMQKEKV